MATGEFPNRPAGNGANSSSTTLLISASALPFLDPEWHWVTIVLMILSPTKKQKIYAPYIEIMQDLRQSQSLSQAKLADAVGLSGKYVTLIEGGRRVPSLDCLIALMAEVGLLRKTAESMVNEVMDMFEWKG